MISHRRTFLQSGTLALSLIGLPKISQSQTDNNGKSIIFIFLGGGISHQESFNASPNFTERAQSLTGYVDTKSGFKLGGHFQKMGAISHLFSPIHSFGHINPAHGAATHYTMTGYNINDELKQDKPSYGSITARFHNPTSEIGLPHYVSLDKIHADRADFLGNAYNAFVVNEEGKKNLALNIDNSRFHQRMDVLQSLDRKFLAGRTSVDFDGYKRQAREMLLGKVRDVFELKNEPESAHAIYSNNDFGKKCLLARRLVENGVKFVTLDNSGWDMHANLVDGYNRIAPNLDHNIAALLTDLKNRGLLENTLVILTSEFSRTLVNKDGGRDHWPKITSLVLAGKNYGGSVIGSITKDGMEPAEQPYTPIDLLRTIMNHMDIPANTQYTDLSGRPRYLLEGDSKLIG